MAISEGQPEHSTRGRSRLVYESSSENRLSLNTPSTPLPSFRKERGQFFDGACQVGVNPGAKILSQPLCDARFRFCFDYDCDVCGKSSLFALFACCPCLVSRPGSIRLLGCRSAGSPGPF